MIIILKLYLMFSISTPPDTTNITCSMWTRSFRIT